MSLAGRCGKWLVIGTSASVMLLAACASTGSRAVATSRHQRTAGEPVRVIHVGDLSDGLAVSPDGRTLYVALSNENRILPVSVGRWKRGPSIELGGVIGGLNSLAIGADGKKLYTANCFSETVTEVGLPAGKLDRLIHMGSCPGLLAVSRSTLYVDVRSAIVAFSLRSGKRLREYKVSPYVIGLAVSQDNRFLYVSSENSTAVTRIDSATGRRLKSIRIGKYAGAITISKDGGTLYVCAFSYPTGRPLPREVVESIPLRRAGRRRSFSIGRHLLQTLAVTPNEGLLFVANVDSSTVSVITLK